MQQDNIMRITPLLIRELQNGEIFVFGSNLRGVHGNGAPLTALKFGAIPGCREGMTGNAYAIPTKSTPYTSLSLEAIKVHVCRFIKHAMEHPQSRFLVTPVGCGHAGYKAAQIAHLFQEARDLPHVALPADFWEHIS